jgi:hypothetical protein
MGQMQCTMGHVYTVQAQQSTDCPVCSQMNVELTKTQGIYDPMPTQSSHAGKFGAADGKTIGMYDHLAGAVEPVVGWLACVEGPDRGRDWRLIAGRNALGRGATMAVRLENDAAVSRERHALISFEPRHGVFTLLSGDSNGLLYHNGKEVTAPVALVRFDRIEIGKSVLVFVPLAGPEFDWAAVRAD